MLFCCLYETWCHNPVATVALCLLTQCYNHVCDLIMLLYPFRLLIIIITSVICLSTLISNTKW